MARPAAVARWRRAPGGVKMGSSRPMRATRSGSARRPSRARPATSARKAPAWAPSVARWSMAMHMFIIERTAMASPCSSRTTGRLTMLLHRHDGHLGHVDDGQRQDRAGPAGVVHREGAALEVLRSQLLAAGAGGQVVDGRVEPVEAEVLGLVDDRHHQAVRDRHGDADVDVSTPPVALRRPVGVQVVVLCAGPPRRPW